MDTAGLTAVTARIAEAAGRVGRSPDAVKLVVVSKGRSVAEITAVYEAGHRVFGENRADELAAKVPLLPADIEWHFVGSLQRRKVATVWPLIALLHSLDREKLIDAWAREQGTPPALLQVNIAAEPQKHGAAPNDAARLLDMARSSGVRVVGLMVIPPLPGAPEDSRRWFADLEALRAALQPDFPGLVHTSMGMTDDFEVAVEEGATLVRVGRAIFGPSVAG
ncbi:MAG TPA: YggS family pyridoxal phosphate-dependent enzyme [Acidimicrobiia bacterium]|jgi:hypothetical protein